MDGLGLLLIIILIVAAAAYFLPSIFAWTRNHPSKWGIIALNILLGWTLLGWIIALIWSLSSTRR